MRSFYLLGFVFLSLRVFAQESVNQETNAPGIKFFQINSPNFRILYPQGFEAQAQRVANTMETIREPESKTMGIAPKKISIVLQNQSSLSNGFVTMAPRRSEFYTMPTQNYNFAGTNDWLDALAVHEYRHMAQFQRSIYGFNKFFYYLFGQQVSAGMAFAAAPQWFWEGDAVATETAFTQSGRGRISNFDLLFRTNTAEGRTYNYHKQYLRSYKNNIPNHYVLGYNMISYLRKKTNDAQIWEKVVRRSWNVPFIPFAFSNALKKETGMYVTDLYQEMIQDRKKDYEEAIRGTEFTPFEGITKRTSSAYTDYLFPQELEDGKILVQKTGIGDIETLVVLTPDGKEEYNYVQGIVNDAAMLSAANQRVVWNEFRYDPRWLVHNYSVIKGFDFRTRKASVLTGHSRYSAAAISPDGKQVATVETSSEYAIRLLVLDFASGKVLRDLPNPNNDLLSMPRWSDDGNFIVAVRVSKAGKTLTRFNTQTGASEDLLPFSQENVGYPVANGKYIYYNSALTGIDNIFALNVETKERFQVTSGKYGAYNPFITKDGSAMYYNNQTPDGMDVVKMTLDPAKWKNVGAPPSSPNWLYQHLADQEKGGDILTKVTDNTYPTKRYHRIQGMINPHSWGPYFVNSLTNVNIGITSQDILSTTMINLGYQFDLNERAGRWQASASYQGFYPILDVKVTQADRKVNEGDLTYVKKIGPAVADTATVTENLTFEWEEQTLEAGLRIPLLTTTSKYIGYFEFGNSVGVTHVTNFKNSIDGGGRVVPSNLPQYFFRDYVDHGNLIYNHFTISTYRLLKRSRRDINSKWGQQLYIDYFNTPYGGDFSGGQFSIYALGFAPGFFKHHSIWGYWAYQGSEVPRASVSGAGLDNYTFQNQVPLPRGQSVSRFQNFYSMSANYTLPLWYPDVAMGPLLNIQRLRGNAFFDYGFGKTAYSATEGFKQTYMSVGGELRVDLNVMRFLPQFSAGIRYSYGISPSASLFEVLIGSFNF